MSALKDNAISSHGKGPKNKPNKFVLAPLHYGLRSLLHIGFSLKKFAAPQENPMHYYILIDYQ